MPPYRYETYKNFWEANSDVEGIRIGFNGIPVPKEGGKELLLRIDRALLDLGAKYELFRFFLNEALPAEGVMDFGEYYYRKGMESDYPYELSTKYNYISYSPFRQWEKILDRSLFSPGILFVVPDEDGMLTHKYIFGDKLESFDIHGSGIENMDNSTVNVGLYITNYAKIWFPKIYSNDTIVGLYGVWVDNPILPYYNTPRLNSFIRDFETVVNSLGGYMESVRDTSMESPHRDFLNDKGILLDGRIVYQEDIDEGRVALPEWKEPLFTVELPDDYSPFLLDPDYGRR